MPSMKTFRNCGSSSPSKMPLAKRRVGRDQALEHLAHGRAVDLDLAVAARFGPQNRGDADGRHRARTLQGSLGDSRRFGPELVDAVDASRGPGRPSARRRRATIVAAPPSDDCGHRAEQRRRDAGLERAELVRGADEHRSRRRSRARAARSASPTATVVERMFMLIMSTKPLTARATSESGRASSRGRRRSSRRRTSRRRRAASTPCGRASGRRVSMIAGEQRADGRGAAQQAEPDRAGVEDRAWRTAGSSAIAPPNSTANRSSVIAPSITGVRRMKRIPARTRRPARAPRRRARVRGSCMSSTQTEADGEQHRRRRRRRSRGGSRRGRRRAPGRRSIADLERDRAQRHRARDQLERHERTPAARAPAATPIAFAHAGRDREHEERPELRSRRSMRDDEQQERDERSSSADRAREDEAPRARGRRAARRAARARAAAANSQSPIRPRSNAEWRIAKTCQPTATATICAPRPSETSDDPEQRVVAPLERGRKPSTHPGRAGRGPGRFTLVWRCCAERRRRHELRRSPDWRRIYRASGRLVLGEDPVERAPRLGEHLGGLGPLRLAAVRA